MKRPAPGWAIGVATMGGLGRLPAPGTWGSLPALPCVLLGPVACLVLGALLTVIGYVATQRAIAGDDAADPGWIVVDETAGMLVALAGVATSPTPFGVLIAFVLFRLLDIVKPWPVSWADRQPGAAGVMLDDLVAGGLALALLALSRMAFPGVF